MSRLYEFEAKQLLQQNGIAVPRGLVAASAEEAAVAAASLGGSVAVKAQTLVGGRGKAGLVRLVADREEAARAAARILDARLDGQRVDEVLVEERLAVARELYVSISVDRLAGCPLILACSEGGVEIEEVAKARPGAVARHPVDVLKGFPVHHALGIAKGIGLVGDEAVAFSRFLLRLFAAFSAMDALLVEVNPLAVMPDGRLCAADAKVILDDDASYRQPFLQSRPLEPGADPLEQEARQKKFSYVDLGGGVAILGNGAGLVMALLDMVRHYGATPANFLDTGGGVSRARVRDALLLLAKKARREHAVKSILIAFSLSISQPEDSAGGVLDALAIQRPGVPIYAVVHGTRAEVAEEMLRSAGISVFQTIQEATRAAARA